MNKKDIVARLIQYDHHYHTVGEPLVSDLEYDELKDHLREIDPKNKYFKRVGADDDNTVQLPFYMGSLDKIKDEPETLAKWINKYKGDYIISDKLDGISALLHIKNNQINMYTRGNGTNGKDITHILKDIRGLPDLKKIDGEVAVRGELIIPKADWKDEYGSNARNVVAGVVNSKIVKKNVLSIVHFVAYDLVHPRMRIADAYNRLQELGFEVAHHQSAPQLSIDMLLGILHQRRAGSSYEIDGIVIIDNGKKHPLKAGENPKYGFAFKSIHTHEQVDVTVREVEWNISKDGYLKPRVLFDPIRLDGVSISAATAYNAQYVQNNNLGSGARISIIRSGGVIPKIQEILQPAANGADMPDIPYEWNDTHVDIFIKDNNNVEQKLKELEHFMASLEIEKVAKGTLKKLFDAGYDSIPRLINLSKDDIKVIPGFNDKSAEAIISSIASIRSKSIPDVMAASNIFGRGMGSKKLDLIFQAHKEIIIAYLDGSGNSLSLTRENIKQINGIGNVTADNFLENLREFKQFYCAIGLKPSDIAENKNTGTRLNDMTVVFTGFRDTDIMRYIQDNGGVIASSVSKNTTLVIAKDPTKKTGSVKKAEDLGIAVMTREQFLENYSS